MRGVIHMEKCDRPSGARGKKEIQSFLFMTACYWIKTLEPLILSCPVLQNKLCTTESITPCNARFVTSSNFNVISVSDLTFFKAP